MVLCLLFFVVLLCRKSRRIIGKQGPEESSLDSKTPAVKTSSNQKAVVFRQPSINLHWCFRRAHTPALAHLHCISRRTRNMEIHTTNVHMETRTHTRALVVNRRWGWPNSGAPKPLAARLIT